MISSATSMDAATMPTTAKHGADRVLSLRGVLEYYYREFKTLQQSSAGLEADYAAREKSLLLELLRVVDSFQDVQRVCQKDRKLKKQSAVLECFQTTYQTFIHVLESQGVYEVPIVGKAYTQVTFRGVLIPEPWTVAGVQDAEAPNRERVVREVLRSLWVRVMDQRVYVLRRAQVVC